MKTKYNRYSVSGSISFFQGTEGREGAYLSPKKHFPSPPSGRGRGKLKLIFAGLIPRRVYQQRPWATKYPWGEKPTVWGGKETDMSKMPTPTEIAVKEAKEKERYKLLLMAKEAKDLKSFIETLEKLINQG